MTVTILLLMTTLQATGPAAAEDRIIDGIIDPDLRSPAPASMVWGSAGAVLGVAPILLFIHPIPILGWADNYPLAGWIGLAVSFAYVLGVGLGWIWFGGLNLRGGGWTKWASRS